MLNVVAWMLFYGKGSKKSIVDTLNPVGLFQTLVTYRRQRGGVYEKPDALFIGETAYLFCNMGGSDWGSFEFECAEIGIEEE